MTSPDFPVLKNSQAIVRTAAKLLVSTLPRIQNFSGQSSA
jgi:hypothetical protein